MAIPVAQQGTYPPGYAYQGYAAQPAAYAPTQAAVAGAAAPAPATGAAPTQWSLGAWLASIFSWRASAPVQQVAAPPASTAAPVDALGRPVSYGSQAASALASPVNAAFNTVYNGVGLRSGVASVSSFALNIERQALHIFQGFGTRDCFDVARAMIRTADPRFQTASVQDGLVAFGASSPGRRYADAYLRAGYPVLVGVRYDGQSTTNHDAPGQPGHALVLQYNPQGVLMAKDPGSTSIPEAPVMQTADGTYFVNGYNQYFIASVIPYARGPMVAATLA